MCSIHGGRGRWSFLPVKKALPGTWKAIVNLLEKSRINGFSIDKMFLCNLGNGNNISFWKDLWYGDTPLLLRWPFLFSVEKDKECVVSSRVSFDGSRNNLTANWSAGAYTVAGISETQDVMFMLSQISFKDSRDRWFWDFNQPVEFSVAAVKESMQQNLYTSDDISFLWVNWVPIKVNTLVWRIVKGRIPTRVELCKRKIVLPCYSCPMCRLEDETVSHILFDCRFAFEVWTKVWLWSRLNHSDFGSLEDVIHWPNSRNISVVKKKRIRGIFMVTIWALWKERNKVVFQDSDPKVVEVVSIVKSLSFVWLKFRTKCNRIDWKDWVTNPLYML